MAQNATSSSRITRFDRDELRLLVILVLAGELLGIVVSAVAQASNPELAKAFATGAAGLLYVAILGAVVSLLFAEFERHRLERASEIDYLMNLLAELKTVYDQVDRGRILVAAHRSAKTYGDEMRNFIQGRMQLSQVYRAVRYDARSSRPAIEPEIKEMKEYLEKLIGEFQGGYKEISVQQSLLEARMKAALGSVKYGDTQEPSLPANAPWAHIEVLPHTREFLNLDGRPERDTAYGVRFLAPLDNASTKLLNALNRLRVSSA